MKSYSHFFSKKFQHICVSLNVNFNESLTTDVVSFEQLGPGICFVRQFLWRPGFFCKGDYSKRKQLAPCCEQSLSFLSRSQNKVQNLFDITAYRQHIHSPLKPKSSSFLSSNDTSVLQCLYQYYGSCIRISILASGAANGYLKHLFSFVALYICRPMSKPCKFLIGIITKWKFGFLSSI